MDEDGTPTTAFFIMFFVGVTSLIGALDAAIDVREYGACHYPSVVSYHPARILFCELCERRWE